MPRKVATHGFSCPATTWPTVRTTSGSICATGGMKQAMSESTLSSLSAASTAARNCSTCASALTVVGPCAISRSQETAASAAREPSASLLVTTATRRPRGSGWLSTSWATSKSWCVFSTRITPACLSIWANASGRSWVERTRCPRGVPYLPTPDLTTMTGLIEESLRAMRENLRGLPIDSR